MFERFTDDSRAVVVKAREEAQSFQHDHIGTEHVLLGLLGVPGSLAAQVLRKAGVGAADVRRDIEARIGRGAERSSGHIPFTPRAKKVLELSLRESLKLNVNYIGTEHILLALEREGAGLGAQILSTYVPDLDALRRSVRELSGPGAARGSTAETRTTNAAEEVVSAAQALAGGAPMGSHHLLEALVRAEGSMAAQVLKELGVDPAAIATKVDEFDTELTTDASQEEIAARKMELRLEGDEVHVIFRDEGTVGLAKAVAELAPGPIRATGPVTGQFVPMWKAANEMLFAVLQSLRGDDPPVDTAGSGKAALLVRRVLHDRLRGRDR